MVTDGIIFLAHEKSVLTGEHDKEGNPVRAVAPDIPDAAYQIINSIVDITGYIQVKKFDDCTSKRTLYTRATPTIFAGSRYSSLEPKIDFSYNNLVASINDAIMREQKSGAQIGDNGAAQYIPQADANDDFNDIVQEARMVWKRLLNQDEANKDEMIRITEKYLGENKRISSATVEDVPKLKEILTELYKLARES